VVADPLLVEVDEVFGHVCSSCQVSALSSPRRTASGEFDTIMRGMSQNRQMAPLGALAQPWIGLAEGPDLDDYASGSGLYAEQALRRLSDRLRERREPAHG
jgi:hypothetical protein